MPPSASDRLNELRRQRALLREHIAWLEREIAGEEAKAAPTGPAPQVPASPPDEVERGAPGARVTTAEGGGRPSAPAVPAEADEAGREITADDVESAADAVLEEYRVAPTDLQRDVRRGCLLYFAAGFLLFVAAVAGLYFALRH